LPLNVERIDRHHTNFFSHVDGGHLRIRELTAAPYQFVSTKLVPALSRAFSFGGLMKQQLAHSPEPQQASATQEETPAPITVYGRRGTDESYEGVIGREADLRIVDCKDGIQWIVQRFTGGQWRNKSFHRSRLSLIRRYGPLEMILALPDHHDGFVEAIPRCKVCGRIATKPTGVLPRHMFCVAMRKPQRSELEEAA
jgi:hypothetical protein